MILQLWEQVNLWAILLWYGVGVLVVAIVRTIWFGVRQHLSETVDDAARRLGDRDRKEFDHEAYVLASIKGSLLWPIAIIVAAGYLGSAIALRLRR